jgi:hypothetical protein
MCWSMGASLGMVGLGAAATVLTLRRGEATAIPATFAWYTGIEALQAAGYLVIGQCGSPANQVITLLSYLHIAFQPFFVNAFAMALLARPPAGWVRAAVQIACAACPVIMLLQLYPFAWAGACTPGASMCGETLCLVAGSWHIAWDVPYNGLMPPLPLLPGWSFPFAAYGVTMFVLPALYGAWRFALFQGVVGPLAAMALTSNPNEMPAIWCLFSVGLLAVGLSPWLRGRVGGTAWPMLAARAA